MSETKFNPLARTASAQELHAAVAKEELPAISLKLAVEHLACQAAWDKRRGDAVARLGSQYLLGWMDRSALADEVRHDLLEALKVLYEETVDYIQRNNLGDVHHNLSMRLSRDALNKAAGV